MSASPENSERVEIRIHALILVLSELQSQEDGKEYLTELDTNKDGFLDLDEIKKHYEYTDEDEAMGEGEEGGDEGEAEEGDEPEEEAE